MKVLWDLKACSVQNNSEGIPIALGPHVVNMAAPKGVTMQSELQFVLMHVLK